MQGGSFRHLRLVGTLGAVVTCLMLAPSAAHAYYVDISITGAGRVYEATDADELDEHCPDAIEGFASPSNTPTGTLGATCRAGSATGDYQWGWEVWYLAEAAPGYRFEQWQSDGRTSPGPVICDGAGGSSTHTSSSCLFATYQDLQTRAVFVDDTSPTMSTLTGPDQTVNGPATFTFSAASDPTFREFKCRVEGVHEWQPCSSGHSEDPPTGNYKLQVRAYDWSGNPSAAMEWPWTVDKLAPAVAITGPANNSYDRDGAFTVRGTAEPGSTVHLYEGLSHKGQGDADSSGNWSTPLNGVPNGAHTYTATATDAVGNVSNHSAGRTVIVDKTAPSVTTLSPASGATGVHPAANVFVTFSEAMKPSTVTTTTIKLLRRGTTTPVAATVTYNAPSKRATLNPSTDLVRGAAYTATVTRGTRDLAGNPLPAAKSWTFTVR